MCGNPLSFDPVLDHDHKSGHIRGVVHRGCNRAEGQIKFALQFADGNKVEFFKRLLSFWEADYSSNPVHPTHKTELDKRIKLLTKKIKKETPRDKTLEGWKAELSALKILRKES